jgi:hypothetical protein
VSGFAASEEKYTDGVTDLSSISMPALRQACLTIACVGLNGFAEGERGIADWNS